MTSDSLSFDRWSVTTPTNSNWFPLDVPTLLGYGSWVGDQNTKNPEELIILIWKRLQPRDVKPFAAGPQLEVGKVYIKNHQIDSSEMPIWVGSIIEFH